jgi:Xaa-Pro aminopeptidase
MADSGQISRADELTNRRRADAFMADAGLDALIATSPPNLTYLTGFRSWLATWFREFMIEPGGTGRLAQRNFAVLPRGAQATLLVEPYLLVDTAEQWIDDVRAAGGGDFEPPNGGDASAPVHLQGALATLQQGAEPNSVRALADALEERGLADAAIGIELEGLAPDVIDELRRLVPRAQLRDCTNLLRLVRAVKTDAELAVLARAAEIAEAAASDAFARSAAGTSFREMRNAYKAGLAERDADFDHFALGVRGLGVSSHAGYTFGEADTLFVDWGCSYRGYYSDTGTTLCFSGAPASLRSRHSAIRASLAAGMAAIRPGVRSSAVQRTMSEALAARGITATFPFGHGFGVEHRDYPLLVPDSGARITDDCVDVHGDLPLDEGMVVNLEVPVFTLGVGSMQTEQSFVVTSDGCRSLAAQDRDSARQLG